MASPGQFPGTWLSIHHQKDGPQVYLASPCCQSIISATNGGRRWFPLCATGFFITKGEQCASFNLQLSLGLGLLYLYPWDIPTASPITALQMSFSPSVGAVRSGAYKIPGGASPTVRRIILCPAHPSLSNIHCFHVGMTVSFSLGAVLSMLSIFLPGTNENTEQLQWCWPRKFTTNINDAVFVIDLQEQSKQAFLDS